MNQLSFSNGLVSLGDEFVRESRGIDEVTVMTEDRDGRGHEEGGRGHGRLRRRSGEDRWEHHRFAAGGHGRGRWVEQPVGGGGWNSRAGGGGWNSQAGGGGWNSRAGGGGWNSQQGEVGGTAGQWEVGGTARQGEVVGTA